MHLGTNLLLDVLADLVIKFELLVDFLEFVLIEITALECVFAGWQRRREEVEEGLGWVRLADETSAVGVYSIQFRNYPIIKWNENSLLLRCFLISNSLVRSLSSFHLISVPIARSYTKSPA